MTFLKVRVSFPGSGGGGVVRDCHIIIPYPATDRRSNPRLLLDHHAPTPHGNTFRMRIGKEKEEVTFKRDFDFFPHSPPTALRSSQSLIPIFPRGSSGFCEVKPCTAAAHMQAFALCSAFMYQGKKKNHSKKNLIKKFVQYSKTRRKTC